MRLKQLFCVHELIMGGSIIFVFSPLDKKYIPEDHQYMKCKKCGKIFNNRTPLINTISLKSLYNRRKNV